jgi:hypothetical protein
MFDPMDYPIAEVWGSSTTETGIISSMTHSFSSDCILVMDGGKPTVATLPSAMQRWPWKPAAAATPAPVAPSGITAAQVVTVARRLTYSAASRVAADAIFADAGSAETEAQRLIETIK